MYIVKNTKTGVCYKTPFDLKKDKLSMLFGFAFIKNKLITEEERYSSRKCLDKWPHIKVIGKVDGRKKDIKEMSYFSWLYV